MHPTSNDPRVARLFGGDRFWSYSALGLLWLLYAFVFYSIQPYIQDPRTCWLLAVGGTLVLLFNTASILVMVSHLSEDREEIYGLDLFYLDERKKSQ